MPGSCPSNTAALRRASPKLTRRGVALGARARGMRPSPWPAVGQGEAFAGPGSFLDGHPEGPSALEPLAAPASRPVGLPQAAEAAEAPEAWSMRLSLLGAVLTVPAIAFLLGPALGAGSLVHVVSFGLYGVGLLAMFIASAVFHSQAGRERTLSKCVDYAAIGLMIAGNFTPYCAILLRTPSAYAVLAAVWALALGAAALRVTRTGLSKWVFVATFLAMGWLAALLAAPLLRALGPRGAGLTVLGGIIYSVGTLFFNRYEGDVEPPGFGPHDIWHVFILAAAGTHYLVLLLYMLPG